jgi:hypothetical protein
MGKRFEAIDQSTGEVWFVGESVTPQRPCERCGKPTKHDRREGYCCVDHSRGLGWCGHEINAAKAFFRLGGSGATLIIPKSRMKSPLPAVQRDWEKMNRAFVQACQIERIASSLNLSASALVAMETGYYVGRQAVTWPMRDQAGEIIGIRTRTDAEKKSILGSRNGLFWVLDQDWEKPVYVTEGPTDCAAMLGLGFTTIGRPSAKTCSGMLVEVLQGHDVVVVGDLDTGPEQDGQRGATMLANKLAESAKSVRLIFPLRGKDVRQWIRKYGATKDVIEDVAGNARRIC